MYIHTGTQAHRHTNRNESLIVLDFCLYRCLLIDEMLFRFNIETSLFAYAHSAPRSFALFPSVCLSHVRRYIGCGSSKPEPSKYLDCLINIWNINWLLFSIWIKQTTIKSVNSIFGIIKPIEIRAHIHVYLSNLGSHKYLNYLFFVAKRTNNT